MKIAIIDECNGKFTNDIREHWEKSHEVRFDKYFDPKLVLWADTTFFDWAGNNSQRASDPNDSFWKEIPQPKDRNIILRIHDIDAWVAQHKGVKLEWINHLVFVAKHIQAKVLSEIELPKTTRVHLIKHGINPNKFIFRERPLDKKIALIGNINEAKNLPLALQVIAANPGYSLHIVGNGLGGWQKAYVLDFIARNDLDVYLTEHVDDVGEFLEDKDFLLLTSIKEAFSFVVGEAMSKGIKPLIHHFYGAEDIWPEKYLWNKVSEVKAMLEGQYSSHEYRDFIDANYSLKKMLDEYNKIIK